MTMPGRPSQDQKLFRSAVDNFDHLVAKGLTEIITAVVVPENSDSISHGDFPEKKLGDILILQRDIFDGLTQHKEPNGWRLTCL